MKPRIDNIDLLKGAAIVLVVMGHFIQWNSIESQNNLIFKVIYSFHMEFFMFLSGYLSIKTIHITTKKDIFIFVQKKFSSLIIPFLTFGILVQGMIDIQSFNFSNILNLLNNPNTGLWFLWFLFFISIFFLGFFLISKKINLQNRLVVDVIIIGLILSILLMIHQGWKVNYFPSLIHHTVFYFIGVILSKYAQLERFFLNNKTVVSFSFVFCILLSILKYQLTQVIGLNYLIALLEIIVVYHLICHYEWNKKIKTAVSKFGRYSLAIYATHFYLVKTGLCFDINNSSLFFMSFFFSVIIIYICIFFKKVIEQFPLLDFLLYGKSLNLKK